MLTSRAHLTRLAARVLVAAVLALAAVQAVAAQAGIAPARPRHTVLTWLFILAGFLVFWSLFYHRLYPLLLHHYHPDVSKAIFWLLLLLYCTTWIQLISYIFYDYGYNYVWIGWTAALLSVLFLLGGILNLFRRSH